MDDGPHAAFFDGLSDQGRIVSGVCQKRFSPCVFNKLQSRRGFMPLTLSDYHVERSSLRINDCVDFR
jgi:hypothetical protein